MWRFSFGMRKKNSKAFYYISLSIFLIVSFLAFFIYFRANSELEKEYNAKLQSLSEITVKNFEKTVFDNITYLENLKERIVESKGAYFKYWQNDANRIIEQNSAVKFVEFIDSTGIIRSVVPYEENKKVINLDITELDYRYEDWLENTRNNTINITNWVALTQGGDLFLVDVPIYYDGKFQGTITAGMDFEDPFNTISSNINEQYSITIEDNIGTVFYSYNTIKNKVTDSSSIFNSVITVDEFDKKNWNFNFSFSGNQGLNERQFVQKAALVFGLILAVLIGLLALFSLQVQEKAKQLFATNNALKELNTKIRKEQEKALKASNAKTQFLSNMSHEIRTPLNAILGLADVIHIDDMSDENKNYVQLLRNSSKSLLSLVNDILDIDKIEMGKTELVESYFQPKDTLQKIVKTYEPEIRNKGLQYIVNFPEEPSSMVVGDHSKTIQIFTNLLNNAIKFTNSGSIQVDYFEEVIDYNLQFNFTINDTGIGISEKKLPLVFDRFVQVDDGTRKKHSGSGLGLAITKGLVEFLNGSILVKSEVHKGTEFNVQLSFPIADNFSEEEIEYLKLTGIKTLIVDDNKINTIVLKKMLDQSGLNADIALSGKECLDKVNTTKYDLIFMDVHMPNIDGFEIVEQIRLYNNDTVIFGFSADVTREAIDKGKKVGMDEYLIKPIDQKRLLYLLAKYFKK